MKLRLPAKLQALLLSTFVFITISAGSSSLAADGFSINFYATGTSAGNNAALSGAATAGWVPVAGDNWNNVNSTNVTQVQKDNAGNALSGLTVQSSLGTWGPGGGTAPATQDGNLLSSYIDGAPSDSYTVKIAGSPYLVSNVYLILSGDGVSGGTAYNDKFTAMSVNGVSYTGNGNSTVEGTGIWGDRGAGKTSLEQGTNVLVVNNVAGGSIVIGNVQNSSGRGTLAGVQVENAYTGTKRDLALAANGVWTGSGALTSWSDLNGSGAWVNSTTDAGIYASIVSTVAGGGVLTIGEGESNAVTTDAVVLAVGSTSDLTISGGVLNLIGPSILRVDDAGRTLTISSAISSTGNVVIDGEGTVAFGSNQSIAGLGGAGKLDIGATTLTVGGSGNASYGGILVSTAEGSLIKTGSGNQTFLNFSQFAGTNITIQGGGLTLGNASNRFNAFNKNVTAGADATLTLWAGNDAEGAGTGPFVLGSQFAGNLIINGVFALNANNNESGVNIGTGKLHLMGGSTFLIRNGMTVGNKNTFSNDIFLSQGTITLREYGSGVAIISSNITGEGVTGINNNGVENTLNRTDGGTLSFTGVIDYKGRFNVAAGINNFSNTVNLGALLAGSATLNFENGAHVTIGSLRLSEGADTNSTVTVKTGSTLTISGTNNDHTTSASFLLNHWTGTSKFNVAGGTVHAEQLVMRTAWSGTSITTVTAGSLNVLGINYWAQNNSSFKGKIFLGTNADGTASDETATGRINLGSLGITNLSDTSSEAQLVLGRGTLGALADWETNAGGAGKTISLLSASGTIFDTQDIADATKGYQITINHNLTGAGKIVKNGMGTLVLNGTASDFTGGIELNKGTLSVVTSALGKAGSRNLNVSGTGTGDATPLLLARDGSLTLDGLTMADGARLNLGGMNTANTLSVSNSVTFSNATLLFSHGDLINVTGNLTATGTLNFEMSLAGYVAGDEIILGSVTGNISNVSVLNSVASSEYYRSATATVSKKADNSLIATVAGGAANLTWTAANTVWDLKGEDKWQGGDDHKFWQGDSVTFGDIGAGGHTVQISGSVLPGKMTLNNVVTNYSFEGGNITVTGAFAKTGAGLWVLGTGSTLKLEGSFSMEGDTLGFSGGTLDVSAISTRAHVDLGILQGVASGSTLNFGSGRVIVNVKDAGSFSNMTLVGSGSLMAGGTYALDISGVTTTLYAGAAGLNITGNTGTSAGNLSIFSGSWDPQAMASGAITIGKTTGDTILDFGVAAVKNKGGIFGAATNIGDGTGITDTSVVGAIMSNISLVGTLSGTGDSMTSNTKITGKIYGGGIEGTSIYGSTVLALDGVHVIGGSSDGIDLGNAALVAGSAINASIYGNVSMNVTNSLVDAYVFGTAGIVTGDMNISFTDSVFKKNVYAGGYGENSLIKGDITLTAENTTFAEGVYGGRDGEVTGKVTLSLKNSTVKGNVFGGYVTGSLNDARIRVNGGIDVILDGVTVDGITTIGGGSRVNGNGSLTIKGNSIIKGLWGIAQFCHIKGDVLIDLQGGVIGEGQDGVDGRSLLVAGQDGKIDGNATLKVSNNAHIKYEYITFAGFGGTGITGDATMEVTGGTVESIIMAAGSWGNKIGGDFNVLISGGTLGKDGVVRGIVAGTQGVNSPGETLVEGNVNITLDGGSSGLGATFLGGATGSNYFIYAGSPLNNIKGNTLVTLSNVSQKAVDGIAGVANFKGVISGANGTGGGVLGTERKLIFNNYTTEVNAQFKYFTVAEVMNASNVTLKGASTNIGSWMVKGASTLNIDDFSKLGGATSLLIDDVGSTVNLALAADATLSSNLLSGSGTFNLTGGNVLTVSANNSGFNGVMKVDGATLRIADNGAIGSASAEINVNNLDPNPGVLDMTGASKTLAQKLTGFGTLALNMATAEAQVSLTNTGSTFMGTMTLTKGVLDVAAGTSLRSVYASLSAAASLKLHDADLSRFALISGAGHLVLDSTVSHTGDNLSPLTGKLSITNGNTFTLTKTSASSKATLNAGLTINLGNESNLVLSNGSASLWDQTIKDVVSKTGSSNITLSGENGVTLRITGNEWKASNSLNFTLNDETLYKVFVDTSYANEMLTNVTLTNGEGVNNVLVGDDGLLAAFTNYLELPVASGSTYTSSYYIVSGLHGVDGTTTVDSSITAIDIRGLKVSSVAADQPGKSKNTSFNLGSSTMTLSSGTLLFDGDADYSISGGTIIGSSTNGLSVNTASHQLTISSVVGVAGSSLNKDGIGQLNLSNTLNAATVSVNAGTMALSGTASADGAAMTVKEDSSLILGNKDAGAYQSGMNSISNSGTVTLLEGASLKSDVAFANNGSINYNIGTDKTMAQVALTGTGTVNVKSGLLTVGTGALSAGQAYVVEAGASASFDAGTGSAFATSLSGMGNVNYKGGGTMLANVSNFGGTFTLSASESVYRLQFTGDNSFKAGTTIVVENNAQFWDSANAANERNYNLVLTGNGHETRGALRIEGGAVYNGTISIVGESAGIGGAAGVSITINSEISSKTNGILNLGPTGSANGIGTVTLTGNNASLAGIMLWQVEKVIANSSHALGNKLTLSSSYAGTQALEFGANVELDSITGFIAGKTLSMAEATSGLTLKGSDASNLAGTISGKGGLTLTGTGVVTLSGNNTYEGGTKIQGSGVVLSTNTSALGTGTVMLDSGSLNAGGLAVSNAITAKTAASMSGMGAYNGALTVSGVNPAAGASTLSVDGNLRSASLSLSDNSARIHATGNVTITNGGSFVLSMNNAYDATTNPNAIVQSGGTVTLGGEFTLTFDTNLKGGINEFKLFSGTFAAGNTATAHLLFNDEYLKTFFTLDASTLGSNGSIFITRNTPEGYFVNQADVDAMAGGYQSRTDVALGAKASGTAADPVDFNKDYHLGDNTYRFMNGEGWLNVQTRLDGANNKVVVYEYLPENGAAPVTDDRGVIFSNNANTFGGGMLVNNARVVVDGSLAADASGRPIAGGQVNILGAGAVTLGGNKAVLELRPLGAGNTDAFTLANAISLRDGASIEQTGGQNTLSGMIAITSGSVTLSNKTAQDMILSGELSAGVNTTLNMNGRIILDAGNTAGKGILKGYNVSLGATSEFVIRNGARADIHTLSGANGTVSVQTGSSLNLIGANHEVGILNGNGTVTLNNGSLQLGAGNTLDSTIGGTGTLKLAAGSMLVMGATGSLGNGVILALGDDNVFDMDGRTTRVGGVTGTGTIGLGGGTLVITGASSEFKGTFDGAGTLDQQSGNAVTLTGAGSSDLNLKATAGEIILKSSSDTATLNYGDLSATGGGMTVSSNAAVKSLSVGNGGTLTLGSTQENNQKTPISLSVTGNASFSSGATINCIIPSGTPQLSVTGTMQLANNMNVNLVDNLSGKFGSPPATFILMQANGGFLGEDSTTLADGTRFDHWNVRIKGALALFYSSGIAYIDGNQIKADASRNTSNLLDGVAQSEVARVGSELLWRAGIHDEGTTLRDLLDSVMNDVDAGNKTSASHSMAAAAGSTITSLVSSQKEGFRQQQLAIRNRTSQMGVNQDYIQEDMPYFNMWMQGNGGYNKLDTQGDESGYTLSTWGGTVGCDIDLNEHLTFGAAFTANYGKLTANAADRAEGDNDAYYVNLFARAQFKKWSHTLILTGGWNDASLNRTVDFNGGSYKGMGSTTGSGYGAMYEVTYDIALNTKKTSVLQPLLNASIVSTKMNGYDETGAGNAGLHVDNMEMTTGTLAAGVRWMGLVGSNLFGRESLGEVRLNIAQDVGDKKGAASVGFLGNPGFMRTVKGSKIGMTGIQAGFGLSVPVGQKGSIYVDGNADFRSGATTVGGTLGYRYNF